MVGLAVAWIAEPPGQVPFPAGQIPPDSGHRGRHWGGDLLLLGLVYLLGRLALQEMDHLASGLPGMVEGLDQAAGRVQGWLYHLAQDAPERLQPGLEESITQLFSNGSAPGGGRCVPGAGGRLSDHCDVAGYVCIFWARRLYPAL